VEEVGSIAAPFDSSTVVFDVNLLCMHGSVFGNALKALL
jgi:hypothetical protein